VSALVAGRRLQLKPDPTGGANKTNKAESAKSAKNEKSKKNEERQCDISQR
jgi:hypothetical protein